MGFDFRSRRKGVDGFHLGAFSWPWMLAQGVGLPIGYTRGIVPGTHLYQGRHATGRVGGEPSVFSTSPIYNDGYPVSAKEAKQMAQLARWTADTEDSVWEEYDRLSDADKTAVDTQPYSSSTYRRPVRRDFIGKLRNFAEWAEKSGGFTIH